jgi:hypothetical protein
VTLVETLVVMVFSALLMSVVGIMFVTVSRQTAAAVDVRRSTSEASNIANVVTTTIRSAIMNRKQNSTVPDPAVVKGTYRELTIISYTDAGPSFDYPRMLRYSVNTQGQMVEESCTPTASGEYWVFASPFCASPTKRILGNVVKNVDADTDTSSYSDFADPVFTYYDANQQLVALTAASDATVRATVASIRFHVVVRASGSEEDVVIDNVVGMSNIFEGLVAEE